MFYSTFGQSVFQHISEKNFFLNMSSPCLIVGKKVKKKTSPCNLSTGPQVPWHIVLPSLESTPQLIKMQIHPKPNEAGCQCRSHFLRNEFSRFRAETFFFRKICFSKFFQQEIFRNFLLLLFRWKTFLYLELSIV